MCQAINPTGESVSPMKMLEVSLHQPTYACSKTVNISFLSAWFTILYSYDSLWLAQRSNYTVSKGGSFKRDLSLISFVEKVAYDKNKGAIQIHIVLKGQLFIDYCAMIHSWL